MFVGRADEEADISSSDEEDWENEQEEDEDFSNAGDEQGNADQGEREVLNHLVRAVENESRIGFMGRIGEDGFDPGVADVDIIDEESGENDEGELPFCCDPHC